MDEQLQEFNLMGKADTEAISGLEDFGRIAGRATSKGCEQFQRARKLVGSTRDTFPTIKV